MTSLSDESGFWSQRKETRYHVDEFQKEMDQNSESKLNQQDLNDEMDKQA
jgi:hypothetical protein